MIRQGIIAFPHPLYGYAGSATQEEAERLSDGLYQKGIIVFVPLSLVSQFDIDRHIVKREDVETD